MKARMSYVGSLSLPQKLRKIVVIEIFLVPKGLFWLSRTINRGKFSRTYFMGGVQFFFEGSKEKFFNFYQYPISTLDEGTYFLKL